MGTCEGRQLYLNEYLIKYVGVREEYEMNILDPKQKNIVARLTCVLDEAQHCGEALLTIESEFRSRVAISYDSVGFYHMTCGV